MIPIATAYTGVVCDAQVHYGGSAECKQCRYVYSEQAPAPSPHTVDNATEITSDIREHVVEHSLKINRTL